MIKLQTLDPISISMHPNLVVHLLHGAERSMLVRVVCHLWGSKEHAGKSGMQLMGQQGACW